MKFLTDVELAEHLGMEVEDVRVKCRHDWPHLRPKRSVWRFTEAMVEQIIEIEARQPARRPQVSAQTKRALSRKAS